MHCNFKLFGVCPIIDDNGVMRVGGRLDHASTLSYIEENPIVMSRAKDCKFLNSLSHITMQNVCIRAEVLL